MNPYPDYDVPEVWTFADVLDAAVQRYGGQTAFVFDGQCKSYRDFERDVLSLAGSIQAGRYYLLAAQHPYRFAVSFFAVEIMGGIAALHDAGRETLESPYAPLEFAGQWTDEAVQAALESAEITPRPRPEVNPDALAVLACSSGTTAMPKAIMLSQANLCWDAWGGMRKYRYAPGARYVHVIPYHHLFGVVADLTGPLLSGGTLCFPKDKLYFFQALAQYQPHCLNLPPALAQGLLELMERGTLPREATQNLQKIMCAGARLEKKTIEGLRRYGIAAYAAYGLTECAPCVSINRDEYFEDESAGVLLPGVEVRISEEGEIQVRGRTVMLGYLNDPEGTAEALQDGWLRTGDLGRMDARGFLYITGRLKNLLVFSDGTKCVPEPLEKQLNALPGVAESLVYREVEAGREALAARIALEPQADPAVIREAAAHIRAGQMHRRLEILHFQTEGLQKGEGLGKLKRT